VRVCIFVANNCTVDSRILRQAETFGRAGHETIIVAVHRGDVPAVERRDTFEIRRIPVDWNWQDGYPRLTKIVRALTPKRGDRDAAPKAPARPTPAPPGKQISAQQWARWIVTGKGTAPRAWARNDHGNLLTRAALIGAIVLHAARKVGNKATTAAARKARTPWRRLKNKARKAVRKRLLNPTRLRQMDRRMAREAIAFKADLYWANDASTLRGAWAAAKATGARCVYDAHEVIWDAPTVDRLHRKLWGMVERRHVKKVNRVYTVAEGIVDLMAERYGIEPPTLLMNCPRLSETQNAPSREDSPLNAYRKPGEKIVLFHGSLSAYRGLEQLVAAMGMLPDDFRLVILGHGSFRATLEDLVRKEGLNHRVTFLQSVHPSELPAWLAGADLGVIPYQRHGRNHEFSTPNKLFEYMHLGIPTLANDLPVIRRIITKVGFGVIADCSDPKEMAREIEALLNDPARLQQMRESARAGAPNYSWEAQEPRILEALEA
jgi:glycosyltransferase involved in cell wall biosynthesis